MAIYTFDSLDSTNTYLNANATAYGHGDVVAARCQTAGRGQRGNSWEAEPGKNLTFSMMLHPQHISATGQFVMSMLISLAIVDTLSALAPDADISIKWPNDIYAGDKKICGILIENVITGAAITRCIAGVGINVNQHTFVSDAPNPVSLCMLTGRTHNLDALLARVTDAITAAIDGYRGDAAAVAVRYNATLWRADGRLHGFVDTAQGVAFKAVITDVAVDGMLTLTDSAGIERRYAFKEVAFTL